MLKDILDDLTDFDSDWAETKLKDSAKWKCYIISLIDRVHLLEKELKHISAICGHPDAATACRLIIAKIKLHEL